MTVGQAAVEVHTEDVHHMWRPEGRSAREERQVSAARQSAVTAVSTMKVLFVPSQLAHQTQNLHMEKVRVNVQKISHLTLKNSEKLPI